MDGEMAEAGGEAKREDCRSDSKRQREGGGGGWLISDQKRERSLVSKSGVVSVR